MSRRVSASARMASKTAPFEPARAQLATAILNDAAPSGLPLDSADRTYLEERSLKKPLRTLDIWALGVGAVITGEYFGWNFGLKGNGAMAMLAASLIVCLLYLTWVLALSELSVAMPFAGGPLAYGRRAVDPSLGFVMGWSMYLECQFATIATALARTKGDSDTDALIKAMEGMSFDTPKGKMTFRPEDHHGQHDQEDELPPGDVHAPVPALVTRRSCPAGSS